MNEFDLWRKMFFFRQVEEEIARKYPEGQMRCPVHLSVGQEVVPAVLSALVRKDDFFISTHRGHLHYLAKGGRLSAMIAELYGKEAGCSGGKGGSMHLADKSVNFVGTSAIVGNSIPVGVGLALSSRVKKIAGRISFVFFGDAAVEEGVFYESVNFAAVRNLPVIFVCENNGFSVYAGLEDRQPKGRSIAELSTAIGVSGCKVKGSDLYEVYGTFDSVINDLRHGGPPRLIEVETCRWREHCGPNYDHELGYRSISEFNAQQDNDPLGKLEEKLMADAANSESIAAVKTGVMEAIELAFEYARKADFPDASELYRGVFK
jgi:TPP-dependent pyruvate/acetoin dehydrogenase alpha subunit